MFEGATLKLDLASKRIAELSEIIRQEPPFRYIVETNAHTGERSLFCKQNIPSMERIATLSGEIVYSIRAALDNAYWEIVAPLAQTAREKRAVQFPFCEKAARLDEAIKHRLADRVSTEFFKAIVAIAPHGEEGGNRLLYIIDKIAAGDRHRMLTPTSDYKTLNSEAIRAQVRDFPMGLANVGISGVARDFVWKCPWRHWDRIGNPTLNDPFIFEREISIPVQIIFDITELNFKAPVIAALSKFHDVVKETIELMQRAI